MGLFTPDWNNKDPEKRMNAVKNTAGIEKLQKIAENADYEDVRQEAWKRLAFEAKDDWQLRETAVGEITSQEFLSGRVIQDTEKLVRIKAFDRIQDTNLIARIMMQADNEMAIKAMDKLASVFDEETLSVIAEKAQSLDVRLAVVEKITSPVILEKIATTVNDNEKLYEEAALYLRQIGQSIISKEQFLKKVDKYKYKDSIRMAAIKKITDQNILSKIANTDESSDVCRTALKLISDQKILVTFINSKYNYEAKNQLFEIFLNTYSKNIASETIQFVIEDLKYRDERIIKKLLDIAKNNPNALKPFFSGIKKELINWHQDSPRINTWHKDHTDTAPGHYDTRGALPGASGWSSGDCVHTDNNEHTDKKHSDDHKGKSYLAQFPPYFND